MSVEAKRPIPFQVVSQILAAAALVWSTFQLGGTLQSDFSNILLWSAVAFLMYSLLLWKGKSFYVVVVTGLLARLLLVTVFPSLSDDIYRFVWDGRLTASGINPYSHLPSDMLAIQQPPSGINGSLYSKLNSPEYYTIYPPVSQLIFYLSALVSTVKGSSVVMKLIFVIAECLTCLGLLRLLQHIGKPLSLIAIYWLNPLVIVEGVGNLHFEVIMVLGLVWSMYFLFVRQSIYQSAAFLSLAIAAKLLPLMLLPYMLWRLARKRAMQYLASVAVLCLLIFLPILLGVQITNFGTSVDLYFQKFEFNASVYYVLRYLGKLMSGYNLIYYLGPLLGMTTIYLIVRKAKQPVDHSLKAFANFSLFAFTCYLVLATTVHPWYLIVPILLTTFSSYRYTLLWSALILLTYINYSYTPYTEQLWIVAIEYILVGTFFAYEYVNQRRSTEVSSITTI